jgi:hypothetical protein
MFGLFKKPCEHERRQSAQITLIENLSLVGSENIVGEVHRPIYYCRDCRVLFLPWEEEKITEFHEIQQ